MQSAQQSSSREDLWYHNTVATFKLSNKAEAVPLDERKMICDREAWTDKDT